MQRIYLFCLLFLLSVIQAASFSIAFAAEAPSENQSRLAPVSQQLVREGDFAVKLQVALGLGKSEDETYAESVLGEHGITPRNGWIADYPMTPDIVGELRKSITASVAADKLDMDEEKALKLFDQVVMDTELSVKPYTGNEPADTAAATAPQYPDGTVINNYYTTAGPPVITYYAPPSAYLYLYGWVPYPFWWNGVRFSGYYMLNDFHRPYYYRHRPVFVSNHFNDVRMNRVWRIDPVSRYNGRTFAGIGVTPNRKRFISTGVARSEVRIFNAPRPQAYRSTTTTAPSVRSYTTTRPARQSYSTGGRSYHKSGSSSYTRGHAGGGKSGGGGHRGGRR